MAKKPGGSPGGLSDAFLAFVGGGKEVKMTYLGRDKFGSPIYRFTWKAPSRAHSSGFIHSSRALAVDVEGRNYSFFRPNSAADRNPIAGQDDVNFKGGPSSDLLDRAVTKVGDLLNRGLIDTSAAKTLVAGFGSWSDTALRMWISRAGTGNRPSPIAAGEAPQEDLLGDIFGGLDLGAGGGGGGGGGGRGGGGGSLGPVYTAPDKGVVEDFVKGAMISLVGTVPEHLLGPTVDRYMTDHRANWESETQEIDPQQSVMEAIRATREYQVVHKLRPEQVDEREWIAQRRGAAQRGGLQTGLDQFAINQATVGGDLEDVERAAGMQQFQQSGKMPTFLDNEFRGIAEAMMSKVMR